jgi:two-component system sensor histidine kinase BaeS
MRPSAIKQRLLWKLLLINILPVITVIIVIIWLAIDHLAANYFMALMVKYDVSPTETHAMFLSAVHRYLLWAFGLALVLAMMLSFLLTRKVLRPLSQMAVIAGQMARGDFTSRVAVASRDEVGRLGTAFNHMADNLAKLEQLRKTMVADVAHELRTPLTNLRGYLEGLSDQVIPPSRSTFDMLLQEIMRLVHLVEDLQQLAKADAAKAFLNKQPLSLIALFERLLNLNKLNFQNKDITLHTRFAENADQIAADEEKLMHAVRNIIENAWQYTPPHGEVNLSLTRTTHGILAEITNSGPAIAAEDLQFIFERFFRVDRSRSRIGSTAIGSARIGGAGIGLSIVKEIIQAHGGEAGATSVAGKTTIWFKLPR